MMTTMKTKNEKRELIMQYMDEILPNASCELDYHKDYELLIAVMLSAQTTDKKVNKVTSVLFDRYPSLDALKEAPLNMVEDIVKEVGLFKNKSKNLKAIVDILIEKYDYKVPSDKDELMSMPGVGNKTAEVVRAELFKIPEFPVDTHVHRISKRLGIASMDDDVVKTEAKLKAFFPKEKWIKLHHQFIHFGRYHCHSQNPQCECCKLRDICKNSSKN